MQPPEIPMRRRFLAAAAAGLALVLTGCTIASHGGEPTHPGFDGSSPSSIAPHAAEDPLLIQTGDSLISLHRNSSIGGWEYNSEIQNQLGQTDRDVGASSVGMGFLLLADRYPDNPKWLDAAKETATWLMAAGNKDSNGNISWPDYVNGSDQSASRFTSFDDGTIGISDFFWRLYEKTGDARYKDTALGGIKWTLAQAESVGSPDQPAYRWVWDVNTRGNPADGSDSAPSYQMGMGEGAVGIVTALASFYQRMQHSDPAFAQKTLKPYIEGGAQYILNVRKNLAKELGDSGVSPALPETGVIGQDNDTTMNTGYLSGTAGAAYMYLKLYQVLGDQQYLSEAKAMLDHMKDTAVKQPDDTVAWPIAIDPEDSQSNNTRYATGVEEGTAGDIWVLYQGAVITGNQEYLTLAKQGANWLLQVAHRDTSGGYSWPEDENPDTKYPRPNLDNGAAGIGTVLYDMYRTTGDQRYLDAAKGARKWLSDSAIHKGKFVYWQDRDGKHHFAYDPSWHWGNAGIIAFLARLSGGHLDIPGEEPALSR